MDKKAVTTMTMSTKKKAKRLGRLKLTDFDSDTESVQMSRYLESEACASLYRNLKIRPTDDKNICLDDDLFRDKSRRLSDSIHLRLSIDHLDIAEAASPSEAETGPPQPRSSGMDESEAISNGFATISGLDDDNSLEDSRSNSSNDERNITSSLESLILIDDDDDEDDSNNRTAASNSNNNNNTNDAAGSSEDECHIVQPDRVDRVKPAKSRNVHLQRVEKGILDNETNKINTFNKSIFIGVKVLALKDPVAFRWSVATLKRISDSSLLSSQATPGHGANYRESLQSLVSKTKYYVEFDEEQQQQQDDSATTIANINRRIRDFYIEDENLNSNGGNQSEVETEKENEAAGSSPSSSSSKRSSASTSGGVNNRCRKSPSGVKLSRTKSHHQLTSNQQQWQDLNGGGGGGGGTFGSMNNLSGISTANKPSNEVELDSKSIALLNNYESFVKAVVTTKMTASPTTFEPSHRVVTVCTTRVRSGNRQLVYESDYLCSGTIVEVPNTLNGGRYLIFFDNGVTGYVRPTLVFPILDLAKFPVDRFNLDHMRFIEYYFREYPNRKMIQTRPGQRINIFFDGSWYSNSTVIDIDASLMEVQITSRGTASEHKNWLYSNPSFSFWIYRGSLTIANILENLLERDRDQSGVETKQFCHYIKRRTQLLNEPIQMLQGNLKNYISMFASTLVPNKPPHCHPDSVFASYENRTSSSGMHKSGTSSSLSGMSEKARAPQQAQGQLKLLDLDSHIRTEPIIFVSHACTPSCVQKWEAAINYIRHINPLLIPQFHGWQRLVNTQSKTSHNGTRKSVNYIAPCGRLMRSCTDVDKYLMLTNSRLTVDMFSFDSAVMSNREFEANCRFLKVEDIANGRENMPISCVNCVDESRPEQFEYSAVRIPVGDVPLKIDHEELEGCNCKDNCRDKMNCSCWRKTFEATLFMGEEKVDTNVGYKNRRLYEMVNTGIFECNPKCKCDCRCVNRVVQNGISIRLQLFKTPKKGWGLRCLDDLPKGTFVCTYEGEILTEQMSDVRGTQIGDVYFAELDFVECLRTNRITSNMNESINNETENRENTNNRNKPIKPVSSNHDLSVSKYQRPKQQPRPYQNPLSNEAEVIVLDSDEDEDDIIRITRVTDETVFTATSSTTTTTTTTYGGANRVSDTAAPPELSERKKQKIKNQQMKIKSITNQVDSNRFFTNPSNPFYIERFIADRSIYVMDAMLKGNAGRYFNHSCTPNIFVQNVFIDSYDLKFPYIAFFTTQAIKAGTELCWDYNYTIGSVQGKRLICHCGTSNCRGRLL